MFILDEAFVETCQGFVEVLEPKKLVFLLVPFIGARQT